MTMKYALATDVTVQTATTSLRFRKGTVAPKDDTETRELERLVALGIAKPAKKE